MPHSCRSRRRSRLVRLPNEPASRRGPPPRRRRHMERFWVKSYAPGVPADVDVDAFSSVGEMFDRSVEKFGNNAAFVQMGTTMTFAELDRFSRALGGYLQGELKLERGARIALMMPNVLQYPIALLGALRGGYVVVNCSPLYTARELQRQLADSG